MNTQTSMYRLLGLALVSGLALTGCPADDSNDTGADSGSESGGPTTTDGPTTTVGPTTTNNPTTTSPSTTDVPESSGPDSSVGPEESSSSGGEEGFQFADDPYDAYTQIDRHAAVEAGTAGIAGPEGLGLDKGSDISIRDAYNASNPVEDAAGMWLGEIGASVTFFHDALDDDLMALMFVPATVAETVAQAGPVIVPDTIKYDPSMPTAYPNGRTLEDPVVDITLAAVLLQLGPGQPLSSFADLPLNPPENDVPFSAEFPYLAPPH